MQYDAIIIGAGMSGLAAGIRLAMFDKKVCILERHYVVGGLNSFYNIKARKFDVGLHAVTNYVPKGSKGAPLIKLLRQLRLSYEDFDLHPQNYSEVIFPEKNLKFNNEIDLLNSSIDESFPSQKDGWHRLVQFISSYDNLSLDNEDSRKAKELMRQYITDEVLIEMILCPLTYYGSAIEDDMEVDQFVTMFKSLFFEGFSRPQDGVRKIIKSLQNKFKAVGGELKFRKGVKSLIVRENEISEIVTDEGEHFLAKQVFSCAGYQETMALIPEFPFDKKEYTGAMTFMESISCLDVEPKEVGYDSTIIFYNTNEHYAYRQTKKLSDPHSGVICCPNNYQLPNPLSEGLIRITNIANFSLWKSLKETDEQEYVKQKEICFDASLDEISKFKPNFKKHIQFQDIFTPHTIFRYTNRHNGAVYGSPKKNKTGQTPFKNLYIIGTDQGFLGIVGSILSGISIANLYGLKTY